jgi:hypothetical protein
MKKLLTNPVWKVDVILCMLDYFVCRIDITPNNNLCTPLIALVLKRDERIGEYVRHNNKIAI